MFCAAHAPVRIWGMRNNPVGGAIYFYFLKITSISIDYVDFIDFLI